MKQDTDDITIVLEDIKEDIKLVCANSYKKHCYPILTGFMVDYKEQFLITGFKANMQYSVCHIPSKEKKLVTRS